MSALQAGQSEAFPEGLSPEQRELAVRQRERFPIATQSAERKLQGLLLDRRKVEGLLLGAARAREGRQKARWMHQAASAWAASIEGVAACRMGCAHCCRIPVGILTSEAKLLAAASGRKFREPGREASISVGQAAALEGMFQGPDESKYDGVPCPFLVEGSCSVYEQRPMICRLHLNLDDDDLLCRVIPGVPALVPYANKIGILAACLSVMPREDRMADIREFFPAQAGAGAPDEEPLAGAV